MLQITIESFLGQSRHSVTIVDYLVSYIYKNKSASPYICFILLDWNDISSFWGHILPFHSIHMATFGGILLVNCNGLSSYTLFIATSKGNYGYCPKALEIES
jgi:hypothetical protein